MRIWIWRWRIEKDRPARRRGRPPGFGRLEPSKAEIISMRRQGRTLQAIADEFGCTRERIRQITAAAGVSGYPPPLYVRRLFRAVAVAGRHQLRADNGGTIAPHGSRYRYTQGCKCAECMAANRAYSQSLKGQAVPNHGNSGYVNYGCRCEICKAGNSIAQRATRERRKLREAAA